MKACKLLVLRNHVDGRPRGEARPWIMGACAPIEIIYNTYFIIDFLKNKLVQVEIITCASIITWVQTLLICRIVG